MAQERIDDFMQLAKYYAKAEKELGVQHWVFISIERTDGNCNYVRLFSYDLPREVYERRRWIIEWRRSKFVCQYPKGNVRCFFSYYDKRLGTDKRLNEDLLRLVSAKAQVTKARKKIDKYIAYNRSITYSSTRIPTKTCRKHKKSSLTKRPACRRRKKD